MVSSEFWISLWADVTALAIWQAWLLLVLVLIGIVGWLGDRMYGWGMDHFGNYPDSEDD